MEFTAVVIDTESTGLDPKTAALVELSAVRVEGDLVGGEAVLSTEIDTLCDPGVAIPAEASGVHHLTDHDVADAPDPTASVQQLLEGLDPQSTVLVAHNQDYDRTLLARYAPEIASEFCWACTFRMARRFAPDAPKHGNQVLRYYLGIEIPEEAAALPAHRALHDSYVTAGLLTELAPQAIAHSEQSHPIAALVEQTQRPVKLPRMPFTKEYGRPFEEVSEGLLNWCDRKRSQWQDPDFVYTLDCEIERRRSPEPEDGPTELSM